MFGCARAFARAAEPGAEAEPGTEARHVSWDGPERCAPNGRVSSGRAQALFSNRAGSKWICVHINEG
eukprot:9993212-Alexandrium_andersonii.AAC.1